MIVMPRLYALFSVPTTLAALSVLLGLNYFGVSGAFLGPLVVSLVLTLLDIVRTYLSLAAKQAVGKYQ